MGTAPAYAATPVCWAGLVPAAADTSLTTPSNVTTLGTAGSNGSKIGDHTKFSYRLPLILKGDLPWQSVGSCHEYTCLPDRWYTSAPTEAIKIDMGPTDRSSPAKSAMYARLLDELLTNPRLPAHIREQTERNRSLG